MHPRTAPLPSRLAILRAAFAAFPALWPRAAVGLLSALIALPALGAPEPPAAPAVPAMTLRQALDYAHAHQPALLASRARVAAARADAVVLRALYLPRVGASAQVLEGTANNTTASYASSPLLDVVRVGGTTSTATGTWTPSPSTFVGVGVRQELLDFGRLSAQAEAADRLAEAEQERSGAELLDLDLGVEETYFAVRAARSVLDAADGAWQRAKVHRDLARAAVKAGLRPPIEQTRAEADFTRFEVGLVRARGGLAVAQNLFAAAVGFNGPSLDAAGDEPAPAELPDASQSLKELEQREPRLREALARWRAQQARTSAIGAELRPDLSFSAALTGRAGGATPSGSGVVPAGGGWLPTVPNWDALIILSWPLFDPAVMARREASRQLEEARRAEAEAVKQRLVAALERAFEEAQVARAGVPALERAAEAAQANQQQAEARFKAGLGTSVELADAEALLTQAQIDLALGKFDYARARARLARALSEAP